MNTKRSSFLRGRKPTKSTRSPDGATLRRKLTKGLTLVEIMIAMVIFGFLALAITSSIIQSHQIAQNNILRNTAFTAAQGYLEQIRSMPLIEVLEAMESPDSEPLPTMSVSATAVQNIEVDDPIFIDGPEEPLTGRTNGSNHRRIMIDLQERENEEPRQVMMDAWFDVEIQHLGASSNAYAIEIYFETELRGAITRRVNGTVRGVRSNINRVSQSQ